MLATLLLSLGVPMLFGGDELGRTQGGNNNAYCQDNATSWFDWDRADTDLLAYTAALITLRRRHPGLRRRRYLTGARPGEISWFTAAGQADDGRRVGRSPTRTATLLVDGSAEPDRDETGQPMLDDDLLILINGWWEPMSFRLPPPPRAVHAPPGPVWRIEVDTAAGLVDADGPATLAEGTHMVVPLDR